jgi:mercuric reductase
VGCIPTKNLLAAASAYHTAGHHPFAGTDTAQHGVDMGALIGMKDQVVGALRQEKYVDLAEHYGFELIQGRARFVAPDAVDVGSRRIRAAHFLITTGSAAWAPPVDGLEEAGYLTSTTALELHELPASMVVIGGSAIGLELGQVFANLGTEVTIVEALDRLAPAEEPEISERIATVLTDQGVGVATSAAVVRVERADGGSRTVVAEVDGAERRFTAEEVLVATGRRPVLTGLAWRRRASRWTVAAAWCSTASCGPPTPGCSPPATSPARRSSSTSPPPRGRWRPTTRWRVPAGRWTTRRCPGSPSPRPTSPPWA